jgi:hypothetical protein
MDELIKVITELKKIDAAYRQGYNCAYYRFSYIDPYYTQDEINSWTNGYKQGEIDIKNQN